MTTRFPKGFTLGFDKEEFFSILQGNVNVYSAIIAPGWMVTVRENDGPGVMPVELIKYKNGSRKDTWLANHSVDGWVSDLSDVLMVKMLVLNCLDKRKYLT